MKPTPFITRNFNLLLPLYPFRTQVERRRKDDQVRMTINQKLTESGEKERLKELLRTRLVECGWRDELKAYSKG